MRRAIQYSKKRNRCDIKIKYRYKSMDKIHLNRIFHKSLKTINVKLKYHEHPTVVWVCSDKISPTVNNSIDIAYATKVIPLR